MLFPHQGLALGMYELSLRDLRNGVGPNHRQQIQSRLPPVAKCSTKDRRKSEKAAGFPQAAPGQKLSNFNLLMFFLGNLSCIEW
jgi:hypothetical protein